MVEINDTWLKNTEANAEKPSSGSGILEEKEKCEQDNVINFGTLKFGSEVKIKASLPPKSWAALLNPGTNKEKNSLKVEEDGGKILEKWP